LAIITINLQEHIYIHVFARDSQKSSSVKLVRDPISVGIDPVRELVPVVFCGVGNTIEVVSNVVLVRDKNWQSLQSI
jgi:hypothetical protein